jgi:signal transduction histidine kinase
VKLRHVVVLVTGLGLGILSLAVARGAPGGSLAGAAVGSSLVLVGVGWALVVCGVVAWARRPPSRFGAIVVAAGFAWLLVELNNPGAGSPVLFTIGLIAYAACPAIVAHAGLAYPGGRVSGRLERAALALAYASTLLALGLLPALAFDPAAQGCTECPRNLLGVADAPDLVEALNRAGLLLGLAWTSAVVALAIARIVRSSSAARLLSAPVLLALVGYLALVGAGYAHGLERGFLSNDGVDRRLWHAQAAALGALVLGVCVAWVRGLRARTSVARLVVELSEAPAPGGLRDALAQALGDQSLELAYPLAAGRHVDAEGRLVGLPDADGRVVTPLLRGGRPVAVLVHKAELRDDPGLLDDVGAAASLALDHERLQAEARAQLEQLRASRARTVEAGDAERRRLERDLHDGAQQRLVVLSFALRLLGAELADGRAERIQAAEAELRGALSELRELARGIYPAVLVDEGLATALEALAEAGPAQIAIDSLPGERLAPAVEAAAYFLVAEVAKRGIGSRMIVRAALAQERLLVEIDSAGGLDGDLVDLEDRIGALDGELTVERTPAGHTTIRAEVPCGL